MNNLSRISKFILYLTVLTFVLWLGGYISRQIIVFQLFEPENMDLRGIYTASNLEAVINTIYPVITYNIITYPVFLVSLLVFIVISKVSLKKEGWLFIVLAAIVITAPFEIYLLTIDWNILQKTLHSLNRTSEIIDLLRERITALSSFSLIEILVYMGAVFLFLFKPLRRE